MKLTEVDPNNWRLEKGKVYQLEFEAKQNKTWQYIRENENNYLLGYHAGES